jgi:intracellular septation protein
MAEPGAGPGLGRVALLTGDPFIVTAKPSLIYLIIGAVMLKRGWMTRYLPPKAPQTVPDVADLFGYPWAALMFLSAGLNLALALSLGAKAWAAAMSLYGIASKSGLFVIQFATMRVTAGRRIRAARG